MSGPIDAHGNIHGDDGRFVSFEQFMDERDRRYEERFKAQEKALILAQGVVEFRLEGLNELRQEVLTDRNRFVEVGAYNTLREQVVAHASLSLHPGTVERLSRMEAEVELNSRFREKAAFVGAGIALFSGAIGAAIMKVLGG